MSVRFRLEVSECLHSSYQWSALMLKTNQSTCMHPKLISALILQNFQLLVYRVQKLATFSFGIYIFYFSLQIFCPKTRFPIFRNSYSFPCSFPHQAAVALLVSFGIQCGLCRCVTQTQNPALKRIFLLHVEFILIACGLVQ